MLKRIIPSTFNNVYRGHIAGLWLFGLLTVGYLLMAAVVIGSSDSGAQSADGVPLNTFAPLASEAIVGAVALLGLFQLLISLLSLLALIRYRAMIPLLYLVLVTNYVGHKAIGMVKPIPHAGSASGHFVSIGFATLTAIGLVLSVFGRDTQATRNIAG